MSSFIPRWLVTPLRVAGEARLAALVGVLTGGLCVAACRAQTPRSPAGAQGAAANRDLFVYYGAADVRYRDASSRETNGSYVAAARLQGDWFRKDPKTGAGRGGARVQLLLETDGRDTTVNRLRASEMYAFYNFSLPGGDARLKVGQFVLPFGLIAVYDTPLQPIQPLYEKSLGLRVDTGILLEGEYGLYRYAGSITMGTGPDRLGSNGGRLVSFRLARTVTTDLGVFEVGGSLMSGRGPVTSPITTLPASGFSTARGFIDKTRIAGDGQYFFGPVTLRGEIVFGGDGNNAVWGYFAEGNYRTTRRLTLVAERKLWNFPQKPMSAATTGVGMNYDFGKGLAVRALFEFERDAPVPVGKSSFEVNRLTLQTRLNF